MSEKHSITWSWLFVLSLIIDFLNWKNAAHTSQVFNQIFQVIACFLICHVCEVLPSQLFVESKDFAAELLGFESRNLSK
jgi:hypothetical protein